MAANQTFSLQRSKIPPKLSEASFKKHEIGNPLLVPPFDKTGVAGLTSNSTVLMDEPLSGIRVNEVTVDIGISRILTDVCVNAEQGSALSVLGPSGCGKTT